MGIDAMQRYINTQECVVKSWQDKHPRFILKYLKDKTQKRGLCISWQESGVTMIGFSLCNPKDLKRFGHFDKMIAMSKAIERARPIDDVVQIRDRSLLDWAKHDYYKFVLRSASYYKNEKAKQIMRVYLFGDETKEKVEKSGEIASSEGVSAPESNPSIRN